MDNFIEKVEKTVVFHLIENRKRLRRAMVGWLHRPLRKPVFVVGCSRAGTTLVYKTFSESVELGSLQKETHDYWAALHPPEERGWNSHSIPETLACEADRKKVGDFFFSETGKLRIVDKNNQNGLSIPYLHALFPDAHFVFIKRNPGDNIESLITGWGKSAEFGTWADLLPEPVAVDDGYYNRWCFFISEGWRDFLKAPIEEVCAFQYRTMNEAILDAKQAIPGEQWHEVGYESLIENPVDEFERLFTECELLFDERLRSHCGEILNKPYNTFSRIEVNKWQKGENRDRIERVLPGLKAVADRLGYTAT